MVMIRLIIVDNPLGKNIFRLNNIEGCLKVSQKLARTESVLPLSPFTISRLLLRKSYGLMAAVLDICQ